MFDLKGKVAIITGAGSGIGKVTALLFAKEGAKVVVADWSEDGGKETVKKIESQGGKAIFIKTDVSKVEDVEKMKNTTLEKFGRIDILINNAGIYREYNLHDMSEEDWDKIISVNLKSVFLCSKAVIPEMLKQGKGKIVSTASIAGLVGFAQSGAYCASKGGIIALTREMALEYAPKKINVNCVAPGVIKTAMTKDMLADPATKQFLESSTPYPRLGEPEDIANAFLYLASDKSDFVNGQVLVVDGGWVAK
jgi:NAD(P)-dependent dehydrogenase (short-subunit alcohol dehydrogenase family)